MATFNEIMQDYVNLPYPNLLSIANESLGNLVDALSDNDADDDMKAKVVMMLTAASFGVDGRLSKLEHRFICDILEQENDYEEFSEFVMSLGDSESRDIIDELLDTCPDMKSHALAFCLCLLAVDETITREEVAFIKKLID